MKDNKLISQGLLHAVAVTLYVVLISWVMTNGESWFGEMDSFVAPALMLMLLVLSAAITAFLVFGRPVLLYLDQKKQEAVKLLGFTIGWMAIIVVLSMVGLTISNI